MYMHPAHRIDENGALAVLRARGFGTLVVADAEHPVAVHVPFLVQPTDGGGLRLEMHVARANSIHEMVEAQGKPALLICQGPDAYISPDWYGVPNQVPTWTYVAVHLSGVLRKLSESEGPGHVDRLSAAFEGRLAPKVPWTAGKMEAKRLEAMMRAIVMLDLVVPANGIAAQRKLIQHKGDVEHRGAIAGLRARVDAGSVEIAGLMEETLAGRNA